LTKNYIGCYIYYVMFNKEQSKKNCIYLDYSATTPPDPRVINAVCKFMKGNFGNPSSVHSFGRKAKKAIEQARAICLNFINADDAREIIFTSGGTEADNLAIEGIIKACNIKRPHIITTLIEHKAILEKLKDLEKRGLIETTYLSVDKYGQISLDSLKKEIKHNTILVSIMYANNEIGTIQPIREIGKYLEKLNKDRVRAAYPKIYFHTDAVQAFAYLNCNVKYLHVDLMSISGHKIYGPKGIGFLYVKKDTPLEHIIIGGGQEFGKRAGTENTVGIVGLGKAVELLEQENPPKAGKKTRKQENRKTCLPAGRAGKQESKKVMRESGETKRIERLGNKLIKGVLKIPDTELTGHPKERLPNLASFVFKGIEGESILINLDLEGIAISTGSACTSGESSYILTACGYDPQVSQGNIRFSLGRFTSQEEIDRVLKVLPGIVGKLREISPLINKK